MNGVSQLWNLYFLYRFNNGYLFSPITNIALDIVHIVFQKGLVLKMWTAYYAPPADNISLVNRQHWSLKLGMLTSDFTLLYLFIMVFLLFILFGIGLVWFRLRSWFRFFFFFFF
jgi:hypothetical protein